MREALMGLALIALLAMPVFGQGADPAQVAATRKVYLAQCAKCHGNNGVPKPIAKDARRFIDPAWSPPIENVREVIANGMGEEMKGFKARLTAAQIASLAEYVLTLKNRSTR